jgi:LysM domain-containing protein
LGGVPLLLRWLAAWPLPSSLPRWSALARALGESEINDAVLLKAAAGVCWVAWLVLTAGVLAEAIARVRGRTARRLPLVGPLQVWAGRLVASALLTSSALGGLAQPAGAVHVMAPPTAPRAVVLDPDRSPPAAPRQYVVQPPDGRRRDTLWGIAERHLGNALRWPEIFELNRGRVSAGHRLTDPHWIYPGEVLLMPDDAVGLEGSPAPTPPAASSARELPKARQEPGSGWFVPPAHHYPAITMDHGR